MIKLKKFSFKVMSDRDTSETVCDECCYHTDHILSVFIQNPNNTVYCECKIPYFLLHFKKFYDIYSFSVYTIYSIPNKLINSISLLYCAE